MRLVVVFAALLGLLDTTVSDSGPSSGRQFVVAFLYNYGKGAANNTDNYLFFSSEKTGQVHFEMAQIGSIPGWKHDQVVNAGRTGIVALPEQSEMPGKGSLSKRAVHVYSDVEISLYAMNDDVSASSVDGTVVLPVTALSTDYVIPSPSINPEFLVVGLIPGTEVTINLKSPCPVYYKGTSHSKGTIKETLGNQDVMEIMPKISTTRASNCDMSGTTVTASHPVAVFVGSACVYKSRTSGCDHEAEQVLPNDVLGISYIVPDFTDNSGYRVKVVSAFDSTHILFNEHHKDLSLNTYDVVLDKGEFREYVIPDGTFLEIFSTHGIHVTQYDETLAPFIIPIPAVHSYGKKYIFSTMNNPTSGSFVNFVNIVLHRESTDSLRIDGAPVTNINWRRVRDLGYSVATVPVSSGSHQITADDTLMVQVYGYDGAASYAFQAGYFFTSLPSVHLQPTDYPPPSTVAPPVTSPHPCTDGRGVDCKVLKMSIGICTNPTSAYQLCRKTCGLCTTCSNPGSCVVG